ncbi:MAG: flagellar protein FlaG [Pseudomonas sp.]
MDMGTLGSRVGMGTTVPVAKTNEVKAATATLEVAETRRNESMTEADREQVLAAVEEMQNYMDAAGRNLQFQLDDDSGRMIVRVTEASTGDVIRQMPSEEALRLAENLSEIRSLLYSAEA